jgi:hypothetical protein
MVISLDVLVQVLALNTTAGAVDSNEFAPFLAHMMLHECLPPQGVYNMADLRTITQISDEVSLLPPDNIDRIVNYVRKARFEGKPIENTQFLIGFKRLVQTEKANAGEELKKAQESIESYKNNLQKEQEKNQKTEDLLVSNRKIALTRKYLAVFIGKSLGSIVLGVLVGVPMFKFMPTGLSGLYLYLIAALFPLVEILWWIPKSYKEYKHELGDVDLEARKQVEAELNKVAISV